MCRSRSKVNLRLWGCSRRCGPRIVHSYEVFLLPLLALLQEAQISDQLKHQAKKHQVVKKSFWLRLEFFKVSDQLVIWQPLFAAVLIFSSYVRTLAVGNLAFLAVRVCIQFPSLWRRFCFAWFRFGGCFCCFCCSCDDSQVFS